MHFQIAFNRSLNAINLYSFHEFINIFQSKYWRILDTIPAMNVCLFVFLFRFYFLNRIILIVLFNIYIHVKLKQRHDFYCIICLCQWHLWAHFQCVLIYHRIVRNLHYDCYWRKWEVFDGMTSTVGSHPYKSGQRQNILDLLISAFLAEFLWKMHAYVFCFVFRMRWKLIVQTTKRNETKRN